MTCGVNDDGLPDTAVLSSLSNLLKHKSHDLDCKNNLFDPESSTLDQLTYSLRTRLIRDVLFVSGNDVRFYGCSDSL